MAKLSREQYAELHCVAKSVRIAFPRVFEPDDAPGGKKAYSVQIRLFTDNPEHMKIVENLKAKMAKAAEYYWGQDAKRNLSRALENVTTKFLRKSDEGDYYFFSLKRRESDGAPRVVGRNREALTQADGKIYSGCFANVVFDLWCYGGMKTADGTRVPYGISATLLGIQFVKDGDPFGGASQAKDEDFEDLSGDDKEDDFDII